ncbi:MAG: sporulation inhibitor of replication protein SirA [Bacilli bacterium]|nr:sporulation inhibitor of replication protein SirA [Bacilli bacterium]
MRIYYLFFINDYIYKQTKNNQLGLYKLFENIYFMKDKDAKLGKKVLEKIITKINRDNLNRFIKNIHKNDMNYINFNYTHILNDFFINENTKMAIYHTYIKIKTNVNFPMFLKDIKNYKNVFVCDFVNLDYFYLKDTFTTVK